MNNRLESNCFNTYNAYTSNLKKIGFIDNSGRESGQFQEKINNILDESNHSKSSISLNSDSLNSSLSNSNFNYFYYKLFDNFGEDLDNSTMVYKNMFKVKLFKDESDQTLEMRAMLKIKKISEKDIIKKKEEASEDFFGPQKCKKAIKERNFKPY